MSTPFIFNNALKKGLYYNWATSVGDTYACITYSAGTTYAIQSINEPVELTPPDIYIFKNEQFNDKTIEEPLYKLTLPVQGIRSSLIIDDTENPYVLIGTFFYPDPRSPIQSTQLIKWDFIKNIITILATFEDEGNSIRKINRYKNNKYDLIYFSFQNDTQTGALKPSFINAIWKSYIDKEFEVQKNITKIYLLNNGINIFGSLWDFTIDNENIYITIPQISLDSTKLSGFNTRGRLFYQKINGLLPSNNTINKKNVYSLIGNEKYPNGFGINSLSLFQVESLKDEILIYSLSDFVYQGLSLVPNINQEKLILLFVEFEFNILKLLKYIVSNLDIDGTRLFKIKKKDLFKKKLPPIYTLIGDPPINTINISDTTNGYDNFSNVYTWASCNEPKNNKTYYGTLDIRSLLYSSLLILFKNIPPIYSFLLNLDEKNKILITELLFSSDITTPINYKDKEFYFDVFSIQKDDKQNIIKKITSNGFKESKPKLPDDGVRNINIITNSKGRFLLVGSTCYQEENVAKNYILKLEE